VCQVASTSSARDARAVVLAGYAGDEGVARAALRARSPAVRAVAWSALQRMGALGPGELAAAFADAAPEVRRRACELAGRLEDGPWEGCGAALIAALSDSSPTVVEAACSALGELVARLVELREEELVTCELAAVARSHPDARCREASVAALGVLGARGGSSDVALEAIASALADKASVRRRAVVALSGFSGDRAQRELERASCDRDWQVREIAQELLRAQPDVSAHEQVTD